MHQYYIFSFKYNWLNFVETVPVKMTGTFRISAGHFDIEPDNDRMTGDFAHHWYIDQR